MNAVGFKATLAGGEIRFVSSSPLKTNFCPFHFIIPTYISCNFSIMRVMVDEKEVFSADGEVPAYCFTGIPGPPMDWPVCPKGKIISIQVRNDDRAERCFSACMFGEEIGDLASFHKAARNFVLLQRSMDER